MGGTKQKEYNDWWRSVHQLKCDAEDYATGRIHPSCTKNSLSRNPLLERALHVIAEGLRLMRNGLASDEGYWQHLMTRAFQGYVTIRDRRWRFTVQDPTREEMDEIMELAERKREGSN